MGGERPDCPWEGPERGLAGSVWDVAAHCWHQDPAQRPTMAEVVRVLREWLVFSLSPRNEHHNMLPAATGWWLLGGLKSQISR